jgi:toxin CcdB
VAELVIRQFDVIENPSESSSVRSQAPYLVVLQSHHLDALKTTIVAPLFRPDVIPAENVVMLPVSIQGEQLVLDLALMANIETRLLKRVVTNLSDQDFEIRRAIDRLLAGF